MERAPKRQFVAVSAGHPVEAAGEVGLDGQAANICAPAQATQHGLIISVNERFAPGCEQNPDFLRPLLHPIHKPVEPQSILAKLFWRVTRLGKRAIITSEIATGQWAAIQNGPGSLHPFRSGQILPFSPSWSPRTTMAR